MTKYATDADVRLYLLILSIIFYVFVNTHYYVVCFVKLMCLFFFRAEPLVSLVCQILVKTPINHLFSNLN